MAIKLSRMRKSDPSGTLTLRNRFAAELSGRFNALRALIRRAIVDEDCLGIKQSEGTPGINAPMSPPAHKQFAFKTDSQRVEGFMGWLKEQEKKGILTVKGAPTDDGKWDWGEVYIESAYRRGIQTAYNELHKQGTISMDGMPGVEGSFTAPVHADRVRLLATRTYNELAGVTDTMNQQIARTLSQAMIDGLGAMATARNLADRVDKIGRTRARLIARTEIMRAHHVATINTYEMAGVGGVRVIAEWSTAGDELVCEVCEPMEGSTYTLVEAMDALPRHPNCRCVMIPVDVEAEYEELPGEEEIPVDEVAFPDNENMNKALEGQLTEEEFREAMANDPEFFQRMRAIACYTNGNVDAVRDPSLFKGEYAKSIGGAYHPAGTLRVPRYNFIPTTADYEYANKYLKHLSSQKRKAGEIFRGMDISPYDNRGKDLLAKLEKGGIIELNGIDSMTSDLDIAQRFAGWGTASDTTHVVYRIQGSTRGTDIANVSFFKEESEVVCSGRFRIKKAEMIPEPGKPEVKRMLVTLEEVPETGMGVKKVTKAEAEAEKIRVKAEAKAKAEKEAKEKKRAEKAKEKAEKEAKAKAEEMKAWMEKEAKEKAEKEAKEKAEAEAKEKAEAKEAKEAARKQAELSAKIAKDIAAAEKAKAKAKVDKVEMTRIEKKRQHQKERFKIPDKLDSDALALRIDKMSSMKEVEKLFKELHISKSITVLPDEMGFQDPERTRFIKDTAKVIVKEHAHLLNSSEYMKHMAYSESRLQRLNTIGLTTNKNIVEVHNKVLKNAGYPDSTLLDPQRWAKANGVCTQRGVKKMISVADDINKWSTADAAAAYGDWTIGEKRGAAGIYTHEIGHAYERNIRLDMPPAEKIKLDTAIAVITTNPGIVLSEYAQTNYAEAFAEIFSAAVHKDYKVKPVPGETPEKIKVRKGIEALRKFLEIE